LVCLLVCHEREPCKTVETIELPFGMCVLVRQMKQRWVAHWRNLANTIELSMCGGDAALC